MMDLDGAAEGLRLQIYSAQRELKKAKEKEGIGEGDSISIARIKKRLSALKLMLSTVEEKQQMNLPKRINPTKPAFQTTAKREFQELPKISAVPNFYKAPHEWQFGYESRCRTIEMDSFDFSIQDKIDRDDETLNNPAVLCGATRSQSRYRDTDFFGFQNKSIIKRQLSPPRVGSAPSDGTSTLGSVYSTRSISPISTGSFSRPGSVGPSSPSAAEIRRKQEAAVPTTPSTTNAQPAAPIAAAELPHNFSDENDSTASSKLGRKPSPMGRPQKARSRKFMVVGNP